MKLINTSKVKEEPLLKIFQGPLQRDIVLMDKFTWKEILGFVKECEKKQLELPF